ncbi:hypothetical protein EEB14_55065 [Rhodococcus sp. WS4]|nr:hypothetical protein EEB14_55065 [Rhodococcus sp. WS4]
MHGARRGFGNGTSGRRARHHGITPRTSRPAVDPVWFHDQYVNQRRRWRCRRSRCRRWVIGLVARTPAAGS